MNKSEFAESISNKTGMTQTEAMELLDLVFETITDQLTKRNEVKIRGFGTFKSRKRSEKMMTNPQTMDRIRIPERYVPVFLAGSVLRESVRKGDN